jgi:hypothetical protein
LVLSLATGVAVERAERAPRANAHDGPPVGVQYRDIALLQDAGSQLYLLAGFLIYSRLCEFVSEKIYRE